MQQLYIVTLSDSCKRGREGRGSSSTHGRQGPRLLSLTDKILSYIHSEWLFIVFRVMGYCAAALVGSAKHMIIFIVSQWSHKAMNSLLSGMQGTVSNECLTDKEANTT